MSRRVVIRDEDDLEPCPTCGWVYLTDAEFETALELAEQAERYDESG